MNEGLQKVEQSELDLLKQQTNDAIVKALISCGESIRAGLMAGLKNIAEAIRETN